MISSVIHILRIVSSSHEKIVEINLELNTKDILEVVMMANFITLTPGTLSVEMDQCYIKLLAIESNHKSKDDIEKGLYRIFSRIFKVKV
jgi:multisubunit Na+/H+ antiporter MnhE subunit